MPQSQTQAVQKDAEQKPRMVRVFKTAVFKMHNPSQHKRAMLRDAMKRAHVAYGKLLSRNFPYGEEIFRLLRLIPALTKKDS